MSAHRLDALVCAFAASAFAAFAAFVECARLRADGLPRDGASKVAAGAFLGSFIVLLAVALRGRPRVVLDENVRNLCAACGALAGVFGVLAVVAALR